MNLGSCRAVSLVPALKCVSRNDFRPVTHTCEPCISISSTINMEATREAKQCFNWYLDSERCCRFFGPRLFARLSGFYFIAYYFGVFNGAESVQWQNTRLNGIWQRFQLQMTLSIASPQLYYNRNKQRDKHARSHALRTTRILCKRQGKKPTAVGEHSQKATRNKYCDIGQFSIQNILAYRCMAMNQFAWRAHTTGISRFAFWRCLTL